jgi:hypothetical protein
MIATGAIWAAVAWASTTLEVKTSRGTTKTIDITDLRQDVKDTSYRRGDGYVTIDGWSAKQVMQRLGYSEGEWTSLTVEELTVTNGEFRDKKPAVFFVSENDEEELNFLRPKSAEGPAEVVDADGASNLNITYRVPLIIDPADPDPDAGETVTFTASVPQGGAQNAYTFRWNAGSAGSGEGRRFRVTYPESDGKVDVTVRAFRGDTEVGASTVSSDIEYSEPEPGTGTTGTGFGTGPSFGTDSYTPPSSDFDTNFPDVGDSSSDFPDAPKAPKTDITPTEEAGTPVTGELLSATGALPPSSGDAAEPLPAAGEDAPADPTEVSEEAKEVSAPGALIASGIIVGLLGLGAGREMENVRPRRLRRPDLSGLRRLSPPWK